MIITRPKMVQAKDKKGKPIFEKDGTTPVMVQDKDGNGMPLTREELAYNLHGKYFDVGDGNEEELKVDEKRKLAIEHVNFRKNNSEEVL